MDLEDIRKMLEDGAGTRLKCDKSGHSIVVFKKRVGCGYYQNGGHAQSHRCTYHGHSKCLYDPKVE